MLGAYGIINFHFPEIINGEAILIIRNSAGKKLLQQIIMDERVELNISSFKPGIYWVSTFYENKVWQTSFAKM